MKARRDQKGTAGLGRNAMAAAFSLVLLIGCHSRDRDVIVIPGGGLTPAAPQGVYSVTGDQVVYLHWIPNTEPDLAGYTIYRSRDPEENYQPVAEVAARASSYEDGGRMNGVTYYYGITAFDTEGNESDFNEELIHDTPRPEGRSTIWNRVVRPDDAGYDFSASDRARWTSPSTDVYYEFTHDGGYRIYAANEGHDIRTDLQDGGFVDFDGIDWAPGYEDGWSAQGWVEAIPGHTYIVWTRDDHYAKLFVSESTEEVLVFDWGYQVSEGNQELEERPGFERAPDPVDP
jgi:hypothetical protein